mmetsp:Transcript_15880/g.35159  ORF Transcript_15880/g.35159 Transcript_15880/m.35159 type:complete len:87 (+) Transcript_15880:93-353(+)
MQGHCHPLQAARAGSVSCDICHCSVPRGQVVLHCVYCDYDECTSCFSQSRSQQQQMQMQNQMHHGMHPFGGGGGYPFGGGGGFHFG